MSYDDHLLERLRLLLAAVASSMENFAELVEYFAHDTDFVLPKQGCGFGSSALKVGGSIFAMLARDHPVVKLPTIRLKYVNCHAR